MKLSLERKTLYEALQAVGHAVSGRSTLPVLHNCLIEAREGKVTLTATDLELAIQVTLDAAVETAGSLTLPAKTITDIVSQLPEGKLTIGYDPDKKCGKIQVARSDYKILGLPSEDYPKLPSVSPHVCLQITQANLAALIRTTRSATSDDNTRPILTGVLCCFRSEEEKPSVEFVATDTHRLAVCRVAVESWTAEPEKSQECIVPVASLIEVQRNLKDAPDSIVEVVWDGNQIQFSTARVCLTSRLLEGQFPKVKRVIPTSHNQSVVVGSSDLQRAIKCASIVAKENKNRVSFLSGEDAEGNGTLVVAARAGELGEAEETLQAEVEGEAAVDFVVNSKYAADFLAAHDGSNIRIEHTAPLSPVVFRPLVGSGWFVVVMPMSTE